MARPRAPQHKLAAALAAHAAGATIPEAASTYKVGRGTLERYKAAQRGKDGKPPSPARLAHRPAKAPPGASAAPSGHGEPQSLLETLHAELRDARAARAAAKAAQDDVASRHWSKIVRDTVNAIERIAPPPPPPPDLVIAALRELDGDVLARIEQHMPEPVAAKEIAA